MESCICSFVFLFIILVSIHTRSCNAEDFHPERTLLMDYYPRTNTTSRPRNFLFRGNMPIINGTFGYSSVVDTMKKVANANKLSIPDPFIFVDVSYLNIFEEKDLKIEKDFFKSNPDRGRFYNKVIVGTVIVPPVDHLDFIKKHVKMYIEHSFDKIPDLMVFIRELLTGVENKSVVIYTHCEAGTDRTGEISGAYYMKFLNMTFTDALQIDNHVQHRDMYHDSRNALQWYCFYLHFIEGFDSLKCQV